MKIVLEDSREGKIVRIEIGNRLDLKAYKPFCDVTVFAVEHPEVVAIVVDFNGTQQLLGSGETILFDLLMRAKYLKIPLRLVNASPEIRFKLTLIEHSEVRVHGQRDTGMNADKFRRASADTVI